MGDAADEVLKILKEVKASNAECRKLLSDLTEIILAQDKDMRLGFFRSKYEVKTSDDTGGD